MTLNKEELLPLLISRVVENAPIKELLRVYGEAVTAAVQELNDDQLVQAMQNAGFLDLVEAFAGNTEELVEDGEG